MSLAPYPLRVDLTSEIFWSYLEQQVLEFVDPKNNNTFFLTRTKIRLNIRRYFFLRELYTVLDRSRRIPKIIEH